MANISKVWGEVIHDSRGDNTIQVTVSTENGKVASAAVPSGASKSSYEAATVDPIKSVEVIKQEIEPLLVGKDVGQQQEIDRMLIEQDGTENKSRLGANTVLGTSLAVSRVAALEKQVSLYRYLGSLSDRSSFHLPIPMLNLINGGKHAENNLDIQEFMIIPDRISGYHNQLSVGKLIFSTLGALLRQDNPFIPIGDEGGGLIVYSD